jgi:hypothetical protein
MWAGRSFEDVLTDIFSSLPFSAGTANIPKNVRKKDIFYKIIKPVQSFNGHKGDSIGTQVWRRFMANKKCSSCNAPLAEEGATEFKCPACGFEIRRCYRCREQSIPYLCQKCGLGGP